MIEVRYKGQLGNNLFQYCLGRILAENLGFKLKAEPIPGFPNTEARVEGQDYSGYPPQILRGHRVDLSSILQDKSKRKIVLEGFFQRYEYYKGYKELIRNNWLLTDIPLKDRIGADDIVICIRRGDHVPKHALPFSYYQEALDRAVYDRAFICTDSAGDPFILQFKKRYNTVICPADVSDNFGLIMSFNKIIISRSTFHWWASFLSNAGEIYFPLPLKGCWSEERPDIDLRVDDDARYIYLKCREGYKMSYADRLTRLKRKIKLKLGE